MAFPNSLVFNVASSVSSIPSNYIRPASNRPNLDGVYLDDCIPQIDLRYLNGSNRSDVVKQTGQACQDYGFFRDYMHEWATNPQSFSLGLERDYPIKALGNHGQHMAINYCPLCPQPELTYGLPCQTDPNVITILLQDDVPGLQVLINGRWVAVNPISRTFTVNIGGQIQVLSNDRYKSVLHRAIVNCNKERISIPTIYCPSPDAMIGPAPHLINDMLILPTTGTLHIASTTRNSGTGDLQLKHVWTCLK
ncbi:protein DMR6-LIKE OXYGENASE 2 [Citrus sinensis]|uniref:Protein DMR6-LIKE OXYGENASE 2 n=1 Tax=Citrus sinensis TaxID=2711 RepID=A0ACB8MP95_CITSI|nr:protein DMR6-LIKE OXYGENASE 2 [Citrus sinensis]